MQLKHLKKEVNKSEFKYNKNGKNVFNSSKDQGGNDISKLQIKPKRISSFEEEKYIEYF